MYRTDNYLRKTVGRWILNNNKLRLDTTNTYYHMKDGKTTKVGDISSANHHGCEFDIEDELKNNPSSAIKTMRWVTRSQRVDVWENILVDKKDSDHCDLINAFIKKAKEINDKKINRSPFFPISRVNEMRWIPEKVKLVVVKDMS